MRCIIMQIKFTPKFAYAQHPTDLWRRKVTDVRFLTSAGDVTGHPQSLAVCHLAR